MVTENICDQTINVGIGKKRKCNQTAHYHCLIIIDLDDIILFIESF